MTKPRAFLLSADSLSDADQHAELQRLGFGGSAPAVGALDELLAELGPDRLVWGLCGLARLMLPHFEEQRPGDPRLRRVLVIAEEVYPEPTEAKREAANEGSRSIAHLGLGAEELSGAAMDAAHVVAGVAGIAAAETPLAEGTLAIRRQAAFLYALRHCGAEAVVDAVASTVGARVLGVELPDLSNEAPPPDMTPLLVKQLENGLELRLGLILASTPRQELRADDRDEVDEDEVDEEFEGEVGDPVWEVGFRSYVGFESGVVIGGRWEGSGFPPRQRQFPEGLTWTHESYSGLIPLTAADVEAYQLARKEAEVRLLAAEDRVIVVSCVVSNQGFEGWLVRAAVANRSPRPVSGVRVRVTYTVDGEQHSVELEIRREIAPGATDSAMLEVEALDSRPTAYEVELLT